MLCAPCAIGLTPQADSCKPLLIKPMARKGRVEPKGSARGPGAVQGRFVGVILLEIRLTSYVFTGISRCLANPLCPILASASRGLPNDVLPTIVNLFSRVSPRVIPPASSPTGLSSGPTVKVGPSLFIPSASEVGIPIKSRRNAVHPQSGCNSIPQRDRCPIH